LGASVGEDLMGQLAVLFLADAGANMAVLQDAVASGNAAAVVRTAHTLRGASANLGATELARLCAVLEKTAGTGGLESAPGQMETIDVELDRVRSALAELAPARSTTG
jgi:two-component system sensor histidine kinase/response regulator